MLKEKPKVLFFHHADFSKESTQPFFNCLQSHTDFTEVPVAMEMDPLELAKQNYAHDLVIIDSTLKEKSVAIAAAMQGKVRTIIISQTSEGLFKQGEGLHFRELCQLGYWLEINKEKNFPWDRVLSWLISPKRTRRLYDFAKDEIFICTNKLQSSNEIGWILDVIQRYELQKNKNQPSTFSSCRVAVTGLVELGLNQVGTESLASIDLQVCVRENITAFSVQIPWSKQDIDSLGRQITSGEESSLFQAWQNSDLFQIIHHEKEALLEVRGLARGNGKKSCLTNSILIESIKEPVTEESYLTSVDTVRFRPFETILDELPDEFRNRAGISAPQVADSSENDETIAKLMYSKSQLVQELSERMEFTQKQASERQRKINEILSEAKTELGSTKKELAQAKNRIKMLEIQAERLNTPSDLKDEDTELQLNEINNSLKKASTEKSTAEEKLALAERKIDLQEKKYMKAIKQLQEKEKELSDTRPIIMKLNKELETIQATLKQQSQNVPVQIGNDDYEKKIKTLSAKVYEFQQKEAEMQIQLKKSNLKLEQAEIGRKSGKNENEGKVKAMERQIEQSKLKEKELLKKIDELNNLLKKAKSGKAA